MGSLWDTVNGLFGNVNTIVGEGAETVKTAAGTAQDVLNNAQDVSSAFDNVTLTESERNKQATTWSNLPSSTKTLVLVGGGAALLLVVALALRTSHMGGLFPNITPSSSAAASTSQHQDTSKIVNFGSSSNGTIWAIGGAVVGALLVAYLMRRK